MAVMTKRNGVLGWEFHQTYIDGTNQEAIELPFQRRKRYLYLG
jgi:hypothetical protein